MVPARSACRTSCAEGLLPVSGLGWFWLSWAELGLAGLGWAGLGWVGFGCFAATELRVYQKDSILVAAAHDNNNNKIKMIVIKTHAS